MVILSDSNWYCTWIFSPLEEEKLSPRNNLRCLRPPWCELCLHTASLCKENRSCVLRHQGVVYGDGATDPRCWVPPWQVPPYSLSNGSCHPGPLGAPPWWQETFGDTLGPGCLLLCCAGASHCWVLNSLTLDAQQPWSWASEDSGSVLSAALVTGSLWKEGAE